ncbi:MAG: hypothetical protein LH606_20365 [Cytophagaceae bacterium]|nr:hypothetical protein [Cytophagaceae bacterium]
MKKVTYTLVGEGFAEYQFLPAYFDWVSKKYQVNLIRSKIQINISKPSGFSKVLKEVNSLCVQSFVSAKPVDFFVAGIDLDETDFTDTLEHHQKRVNELIVRLGKLHKQFSHQIILFVPIQAIDHWINYQQVDSIANSLESKSKKEIKRLVYGHEDAKRFHIERISLTVGKNADFDELAKQSRSFRHFHNQVQQFLSETSQ